MIQSDSGVASSIQWILPESDDRIDAWISFWIGWWIDLESATLTPTNHAGEPGCIVDVSEGPEGERSSWKGLWAWLDYSKVLTLNSINFKNIFLKNIVTFTQC